MRFASCERRKPAERLRPCKVSSSFSFWSSVKNTLACDRSGETSTEVMVSMPTRGSRISRAMRSESSRWIRSPSFCGRPEVRPLVRFKAPPRRTLECPGNLQDFKDLELVLLLEVAEVLHRHAALEAGLHLAHVVLEALERVDLARMDDHVVAQHAQLRAALDEAFQHVAAGNGADLRNLEHLAHLDQPEHLLLLLRREHAGERRLDLVDRLVNDVVVLDLDAGG